MTDRIIVQRINFIERAPLVFTYRRMMKIGGGLLGILLLVYGCEAGRAALAGRKAERLSLEIGRLKAERERILKVTEAETPGYEAVARAALINLFEKSLTWSSVLRDLTDETPRSLWLTSLKSSERPDALSRRGIQVKGQSEDAATVTLFLKSLSDSPYFEHIVLTSSRQESGPHGPFYSFDIEMAVKPVIGKGGAL